MAAAQEIGIRIGLQGAREVDEGLARIRGGMDRMGSAATTLRNAMGGLAGAFAGVVSVREFVQAADSITELQNRLKLATGGAQQAAQAYSALYDIAQRSRTGFVELGQTFSTITTAASALGVSQDRLLRVTEAIGNAVTISGSSAQAAQAALMQLGQGLASGTLRGEELNSVMEQTPRLAQALADGLGVSRGELRKLGEQGAITAEQVIKALESQADMLSGEVKNATLTVGQAMTQLQNSVVRLVGDADKASGATTMLASSIGAVADQLDALRQNSAAMDVLRVAGQAVYVLFTDVAFVMASVGREIGGIAAQAAAVARLDFRGAASIRDAMLSDAQLARADLDSRQARILAPQAEPVAQAVTGAGGGRGAINPETVGAVTSAARKNAEAANALLQKLDGVPSGYLKDMEELIRLHEAGAISAEAYQKALGTMQAQILKNEKTGKPARADAAAAARLAKEQAQAEEKALQLLLQVRQNAANARNAEANEIDAYMRKQEQAAEQALASVNDRISALRDEEAAVTMAASLNISLAEAVERVALARLQEEQAKYTQGSEGWQAIEREIAARKELLGLISDKDAREHAARAADRAAADWEKTADQINQSLTDALMRGFESGKDFAQNLRDTVVNMFKTMVLRPVVSAIVSPISGALLGGLGLAGSAAASQGQGINGVSTAISGASLLGSIGGSVLGGAGWLTGATTLGGSLSAGMSLLGTGSLAGAGAGLGMLAGALGPIALGIGLLSSMFSRKLKDQGIEGTLGGAAGFEGQQYRFYEGGLLRSDKTTYSAIDPELARVLAGGFSAVQDQVTDFAEALSLPTDRIKGFTTDIKVSFKGLDEAGIQKALQDALATGSNELAQQVLGTLTTTTREVTETLAGGMGDWGDGTMQTVTRTIEETTYAASEYAREGEKAIDTLTRLATSVTTVNDWFERLGLSLYEASLQGADAASSLADLFGGLENFSAAASSYYEAYYSEAERAAQVTREVAEGLAELGISMPASREGFRALVEAQDLSTEAGRATYAALLQLAPAFASVTASVQSAEDALEQQRRDAYSALERSAAAQKRVLQGQLQAARDVAGALESVFGVLHDNVRELYGEVESTRAQQAAQASRFIAQAVATALASGYLPDSDQLSEAIAAARGGLDASNYGGDSAERDYAALVLAGQLAELEDVAGKQLTDAQRTVAELERQTEQLDETLVFWQQQIDIASGTYAGVLGVSAAIDRLSSLLGGGGGAPGGPASIGGGGEVIGPAYRDRGVVPRADYGADVALTSFDKFKAWYQGHATNANVAALQSSDYVVPDWMRVSHAPSNDDEMFGAYLFFKNNPQFAADFEQIMTTGRSSMPTDGSTLVRSDLSKMPADVADFFAGDRNSLLSYEAFGLDPVLGYRLYKDGPEQFGLDIRRENFTEWLRTHKWTPDGIVESNNTLDTARPYDGYKLPRWDTSTGNIVDLDGGIYSPDGRRIGTAGRDLMTTVYGAAFVSSLGSDFGDTSSQVGADDYYVGLRQKFDAAIAGGQSAQDLADEIARSGVSMADVAAAYGISVAVLEENLRNGGATNIPQFADGGDHQGGLRIVGERGWEVEATGPARIWNQQQLAQALSGNGNAELVAEVRALRQEVAALRAAGEATADNTGKSANVLVAVQRGNSLSQVAEPTF